jgi:hypothetical protein
MARVQGQAAGLVEVRPDRPPASLLRRYLENERAILGVLSFVGFFLFWEVGAAAGWVDTFFFASPSRIVLASVNPELETVDVYQAFTYGYLDRLKEMGFNDAVGVPQG